MVPDQAIHLDLLFDPFPQSIEVIALLIDLDVEDDNRLGNRLFFLLNLRFLGSRGSLLRWLVIIISEGVEFIIFFLLFFFLVLLLIFFLVFLLIFLLIFLVLFLLEGLDALFGEVFTAHMLVGSSH